MRPVTLFLMTEGVGLKFSELHVQRCWLVVKSIRLVGLSLVHNTSLRFRNGVNKCFLRDWRCSVVLMKYMIGFLNDVVVVSTIR